MPILPYPPKSRRRTWLLRCCPFSEHLALLADLEYDALTDPDIAHLLTRAHYLLAGKSEGPAASPWWTR